MKRFPLLMPALLTLALGATAMRTATTPALAQERARAAGTWTSGGDTERPGVRRPASDAVGEAVRELGTVLRPSRGRFLAAEDDRAHEKVRETLRQRAAGTYIDEMLLSRDSSLARWPDRRDEPVRVWIQPASLVSDWTSAYVAEVEAAFIEWNSLDLPARFRFVADSADAEVTVRWVDRFNEPISGRTRWARDGDYWITDAAISLAVHHRDGVLLDLDSMRAMALHEIGHLLGLDHTSDLGSIMAPRVRVRSLSDSDRATAELLYAVPPGTLR